MSVIDVWAGSVPEVIGRGPVAQGFAPSSQWPPHSMGFTAGQGTMCKGALALHLCLGDSWLCGNGLSRGASLWVSKDMHSEFTAALKMAQEGAAEPGKHKPGSASLA